MTAVLAYPSDRNGAVWIVETTLSCSVENLMGVGMP
jgi:hypothetical protein